MEIMEIGNRGLLFRFPFQLKTFSGIVNSFVIITKNIFYICDTSVGPDNVNAILKILETRYGKKEIIGFNSHEHWDHIWGNCALEGKKILSSRITQNAFDSIRQKEFFSSFQSVMAGKVTLYRSNEIIEDEWRDDAEHIRFFISPGHTAGGASVFDEKENVLYCGDNIDMTLPTIYSPDLDAYLKTLKKYKDFEIRYLLSGHDDAEEKNPYEQIDKNIDYLQILKNEKDFISDVVEQNQRHKRNKRMYNALKYLGDV